VSGVVVKGMFIPVTCQWMDDNCNLVCSEKVIPGKSYCEHHYKIAYLQVDEAIFKKEIEQILKELK